MIFAWHDGEHWSPQLEDGYWPSTGECSQPVAHGWPASSDGQSQDSRDMSVDSVQLPAQGLQPPTGDGSQPVAQGWPSSSGDQSHSSAHGWPASSGGHFELYFQGWIESSACIEPCRKAGKPILVFSSGFATLWVDRSVYTLGPAIIQTSTQVQLG